MLNIIFLTNKMLGLSYNMAVDCEWQLKHNLDWYNEQLEAVFIASCDGIDLNRIVFITITSYMKQLVERCFKSSMAPKWHLATLIRKKMKYEKWRFHEVLYYTFIFIFLWNQELNSLRSPADQVFQRPPECHRLYEAAWVKSKLCPFRR